VPVVVPVVSVPRPREQRGGRPDGMGERIARRFFSLCESPRTRERMMRLLRSSADSAVGGRLLVAVLSRMVFVPMLRSRRVDAAAAKLELLAAQLGGIAVLRYVTRMEPVASMPVEDLVRLVAPSLQATLDS
jgi:Tetracyclin repressor-like, C-terminal domain